MHRGMSSTRSRVSEPLPTDTIGLVTRILEGYATNGVFRGFSVIAQTKATAKYRIVWHERTCELLFSVSRRTLRFGTILSDSSGIKEISNFVELLHSSERPPHRRIDPARARLRCFYRGGNIFFTITVIRNDFEYATRKLIHAANEILIDAEPKWK